MRTTSKRKYKYTFIYPDFEYRVYNASDKKNRKVKVYEKGGWYHEGIAQLGAVVENAGWDVDMIHMLRPFTKAELLAEIRKRKPNVIGINVRTDVWPYCEQLAKWLYGRKIHVMAGSYHTSIYPEDVIKWKGIDSIVIGEGEIPLMQFLKRWPKLANLRIGRMWFKKPNGEIIKNKSTGVIEDIDKLPLPKFNLFNFKKLISSKSRSAVTNFTRGCPYRCTYCWNNFHVRLYPKGTKFLRFRSANNAIEYLKKLMREYPEVERFRFMDDILPVYKEWREQFQDRYIKEVNIPFTCNFRANFLDEPTTKFLKKLGCLYIFFGVESGNDEILDKILKRSLNKKVVLKAFEYCHKYGIKTVAYNIVGIPFESYREFLETIKFNARLRPTQVIPMIFCPYPATELTDIAIEAGFYDPTAERKKYVSVTLPDFTPDQVLFSATFFSEFMKAYIFAYKLPKPFAFWFEKFIDSIYFSPLVPRKLLTMIRVKYKEEVRNRFLLYIKLHFALVYRTLQRWQGK